MGKIGLRQADTPQASDLIALERPSDNVARYASVSEVIRAALASGVTLNLGNVSGGNYFKIYPDGTVKLFGVATVFEDLRIDATATRTGVVAPTDEVGFRGSANFYSRNFVHNQADEIQFSVQMPHAWKEGGELFPHVHFSPWIANAGAGAAQFIFEYFQANNEAEFPGSPATYTVTKTWTGSKIWYHLIASNATSIDTTGWTISTIVKTRMYRDNTVSNNLAGKVALLYVDWHYEIDALGSMAEYVKWT